MSEFVVKQLTYNLSSQAGLAPIGKYLKRINLSALVDPAFPGNYSGSSPQRPIASRRQVQGSRARTWSGTSEGAALPVSQLLMAYLFTPHHPIGPRHKLRINF
jgi:hypothetical protein